MRKFYTKSALVFSLAVVFALLLFNNNANKILASSFNQSNLISDGAFIDINSMSVAEIQSFLTDKGSFLGSFSEGGRSAAQIIWDASHGYNEASGSINGISVTSSTGTVSPKVLLVTLQKEQSLISRSSDPGSSITNKAMGYGCPDSGGCSATYSGFTKQVENGAWQLRYNYERAQGTGFSDYQVGQSATFSDWNGNHSVTFDNRATASLYRYTPHVYNGNYNFWNLYTNTYSFETPLYAYSWVTAGPQTGPGSARDPITPGQSAQLYVTLRNTGTQTWSNTGSNPVHLGMSSPKDRGSSFTAGQNVRMSMDESSVAPGSTGTFRLNITAPYQPGDYWEHFDMVIEGIRWVGGDLPWFMKVGNPLSASYVNGSQGPHVADSIIRLSPGESTTLTVQFTNTSGANWYNTGGAPIYLGPSNPRDRGAAFTGGENRRALMVEGGIANGETATFNLTITAPSQTGTYKEYYDLVVDNVGWIYTGLYWDIVVQ